MKSQLIALAAAALLASASGASLAQDANPAPATPAANGVRDACMADVMKACPDVHDRDSFRACLMSHYADMSDGCKAAVTAMRSSMQSSGGH
jgi:hypothetical protein